MITPFHAWHGQARAGGSPRGASWEGGQRGHQETRHASVPNRDMTHETVADMPGRSVDWVNTWTARRREGGLAAFRDLPRPGRPPAAACWRRRAFRRWPASPCFPSEPGAAQRGARASRRRGLPPPTPRRPQKPLIAARSQPCPWREAQATRRSSRWSARSSPSGQLTRGTGFSGLPWTTARSRPRL